jgi:hypothetical protein
MDEHRRYASWLLDCALINARKDVRERATQMKRYRATLSVTYTQNLEADALTEEDAIDWMKDAFDPTRCWNTADVSVYDIVEVSHEST